MVDLVDAGSGVGKVEIYSGTQPAVNGSLTGTLLASFDLDDPAFGNAAASGSGAVATAASLPIASVGLAAGAAGYGAVVDSDDTVRWTGTVTVTGGGGDFTIDNTSIAVDQVVNLTAFTFTLPQTA